MASAIYSLDERERKHSKEDQIQSSQFKKVYKLHAGLEYKTESKFKLYWGLNPGNFVSAQPLSRKETLAVRTVGEPLPSPCFTAVDYNDACN